MIQSEGVSVAITVADSGSTDGTVELVKTCFPAVRVVVLGANVGYAAAVNRGWKAADDNSGYVVIANADLVFDKDCLRNLVKELDKDPAVGVVGAQQRFPNGSWQRSYGNVPGLIDACSNVLGLTSAHNWTRRLMWPRRIDRRNRDVGYIDGAAMAIRRRAFEMVGGFDESYRFYVEEAEFCWRLKKAGWKVVFVPAATLVHLRGGSSQKKTQETRCRLLALYIAGKMTFARQRYCPVQLNVYRFVEIMHARKMELFCACMARLASGVPAERWRDLRLAFGAEAKTWRLVCKRADAELPGE